MDLHLLHDGVVLMVDDDRAGRRLDLKGLLRDLSFVKTEAPPAQAAIVRVSVRSSDRAARVPRGGRLVLLADGLHVVEVGRDVYVIDGGSFFHVHGQDGRGMARLAPAFDSRPLVARQRFWAFGLLKLLRQQGLFGLHAAAVSTPLGSNLLLVGPSGCGKSTMAIDLIRSGGQYVSDDAVLLRADPAGIEALALRRPFSIDMARAADYPDLIPDPGRPGVGRKRRADVHAAYPSQHVRGFRPHALVFPHVVPRARSRVRVIDRSVALRTLLAQSGPELFDQSTMAAHLDVLARLLRQTTSYELSAGRDLHRDPNALVDLLQRASGGSAWPGVSSN